MKTACVKHSWKLVMLTKTPAQLHPGDRLVVWHHFMCSRCHRRSIRGIMKDVHLMNLEGVPIVPWPPPGIK